MSVNGIDVSSWQEGVDWNKVHDAGYSFAYAKASEGATFHDGQFAANHVGEARESMLAGAYHYLTWNEDADAQAENFLAAYSPHIGDLPPALDIEGSIPSQEIAIPHIARWTDHVEKRMGGTKCLLYIDYDNLVNVLPSLASYFAGHPIWLAAYSRSATPPRVGMRVLFWQYTDQGKVPGIRGYVDMTRFLGNLNDLRGLAIHQLR